MNHTYKEGNRVAVQLEEMGRLHGRNDLVL